MSSTSISMNTIIFKDIHYGIKFINIGPNVVFPRCSCCWLEINLDFTYSKKVI